MKGTTSESSSLQTCLKTHLFKLDAQLLIKIHDLMVRSRMLEERLIQMYKQSDGYFWIGGPGEEAFNCVLGLQLKVGQGLDYDFLHLHYRSLAILIAMGMAPIDALRQMKNTVTDPFSGGRNFSNHFSVHQWNVAPISSIIETQYAIAIGTAIAHRRHGGDGITIVNGGEAGTAEGEFASCLFWSSRPNVELPILIIVMNNAWGISTLTSTQQRPNQIIDRGKAFGMKTMSINGNDVEESYFALQECMSYVRQKRKPAFLEVKVSRLYGHSSATGCNFVTEEEDCLSNFESQLESAKILTQEKMEEIRLNYNQQFLELSQKVKQELTPDPITIYDYVYCKQKGRYW